MSAARQFLPPVFISHGAPTLVMTPSPERDFLSGFGQQLPKPSAILVISAHWDLAAVRVLSVEAPPTVHDFYGFPAPLYQLQYPAPGAPSLAEEVIGLLNAAGFNAEAEDARGLDHGVWAPLSLMYPAADIPVTQISINARKSPYYHWRLGRALGGLPEKGVLVMGSGALTHNLRDCVLHDAGADAPELPYVHEFSQWVAEHLEAGQLEALLGYRERAPGATRAHPTDEHLLPLFTAMGAAGVSWSAQRVYHSVMHVGLAMDHYVFNASSALQGRTAFN